MRCGRSSESSASSQSSKRASTRSFRAASERPIEGVSGQAVASKIERHGSRAHYAASFADAIAGAVALAEPGDAIITLGAGSVSQLGPQVVEQLGAQRTAATTS